MYMMYIYVKIKDNKIILGAKSVSLKADTVKCYNITIMVIFFAAVKAVAAAEVIKTDKL